MLSLFRKHFKRKTLKRNIHRYVVKKKDICCETDIDRSQVIDHIFQLYSEIAGKNSLLDIYTDFSKFIGDKETLTKQHDNRGLAVWNELSTSMQINHEVDKDAISNAFHEVPLYYLMAFLGYAYYRHKEDVHMSPSVSASPSVSPSASPVSVSFNSNLKTPRSQTRSKSPKT